MTLVYKIAPGELWRAAEERGVFSGMPVDLADGYIHFSTADQVRETASKHFYGQRGLILAAVDVASLGESLKWEVSRGGALFPHLYGSLSMSAVRSAHAIPLDANGALSFEGLLP